ncbi:MAG: hypothetical protein KF858_10910 [Candidatus Sumerlaeia bacterium]|nr:hypothetical protein [Candidatus Sumerlaeia bacterium]
MSNSSPDHGILILEAIHQEEVEADLLVVHLELKGSTLVQGNAALKEVKELADLVKRAAYVGIKPDSFVVHNIQADTSTGLVGKTTVVTYTLRLLLDNVGLVPAAMRAISETKNAGITLTRWEYTQIEQVRNKFICVCLATIMERARLIAESVGARLGGIHRLTENFEAGDDEMMRYMPIRERVVTSRGDGDGSGKEALLGFSNCHRERMVQRVTAEIRLLPAEASARPAGG